MVLFSGNSNQPLTEKLAHHLGVPVGKAMVDCFSDHEVRIEITDNVRGSEAFIIQSTNPPAENLMELVLMADALRRASAINITAVIPYYGYARQDRRVRSARVPISARVVADMLSSAGIDRVLTVDLHADQIQGFFCMPVDNVYSLPVMLEDIKQRSFDNLRIISPDVGGVLRARAYIKHLPNSDLAIIDKRRPKPNESRVMHIIGDVDGADCIIVDDIVDTAGTLCKAVAALKEHGAKSVSAYITHPVLSGPAIDNIDQSDLDELVVVDTLCLSEQAKQCERIRQISIADILAQSITRVHKRQSLSSLFL
ncbi:MAG: ribose-phosphate pyrophosphokinase [Gammaproteobacteria bacterium]|nr:ribose-phosphate pyrophosphokinase [Gammaproteobacteria bacterium]